MWTIHKYLHMVVLSFIVIFLCGGYIFYSSTKELDTSKEALLDADIQSVYPELPPIFSYAQINDTNTNNPIYTNEDIATEYQESFNKNSDLAGFIEIEDVLSLPVMHTPQDPEFYLTHYFDKTEKSAGTPFMDARCSFNPKSDNVIIHGHNMNNKSMFSPLPNYKDEQYYKKHPIIIFNTLYEKAEYEILGAFVSTHDKDDMKLDGYFQIVDFDGKIMFDKFVTEIKELSLYDTGITPQYGDTFITLMTCTNEHEDDRMNVIAVKKEVN